MQPVFLGFLLAWLNEGALDVRLGVTWATGLVVMGLMQTYVHHMVFYYTMVAGWTARMAMSGLIHRKLLRLHASSLQQSSSGSHSPTPIQHN